jgi:RNA polymerase sigma factor (sigma-70 family)
VAARPLPSDETLRRLLATDLAEAWRVFIESYTPMLVGLIERAGMRDRDEVMELYTLVCERLSADGCQRLRRRDQSKGALGAWLAVVVRHTIVDWVRQRAGRRRHFASIQELDSFHREVFELYFWEERAPSEMVEELRVRLKRAVSLGEVLTALDRIHETLSDRQRSELLSMAMRARPALSLDEDPGLGRRDVIDQRPTADETIAAREVAQAFEESLAALPHEDAAIIRLRYIQALSLKEVQHALHLPELSERRVRQILDVIRDRLQVLGAPAALNRRALGGDGA